MSYYNPRTAGKAETITDILVTTLNLAAELYTGVEIFYDGDKDECRIAVMGDERVIRHTGHKWEAKRD